jgi:DNA-binding ferritin-like protein (Dps family)
MSDKLENSFHMFCIKKFVFIVSANVRPCALPRDFYNTYEGVTAVVYGFGLTSQRVLTHLIDFYTVSYTEGCSLKSNSDTLHQSLLNFCTH